MDSIWFDYLFIYLFLFLHSSISYAHFFFQLVFLLDKYTGGNVQNYSVQKILEIF